MLLSHLLFEVEVEGGYTDGLVVGVVVFVEVRVFERRLHRDPLPRVEHQHLPEQIQRLPRGRRVQLPQGNRRLLS